MITAIPVVGWDSPDESWLTARLKGLGASEVASALGIDGAYETPWQVWARKTGRWPGTFTGNSATELGNDLEPWLIEQTGRALGDQVLVRRTPARLYRRSGEHWMVASPDAAVYNGTELVELVECKTAGLFEPAVTRDWTPDVPPLAYEIQAVWQMAVTGIRSRVHVAALAPPLGFHLWTVEWDPIAEDLLVCNAAAWWSKHVLGDREPELTAADDTAMIAMYKDVQVGVAEIDPELYTRYVAARERVKDADKGLSVAKAQMKRALAGREVGKIDGRTVATYKKDSNGIRRLRVVGDG